MHGQLRLEALQVRRQDLLSLLGAGRVQVDLRQIHRRPLVQRALVGAHSTPGSVEVRLQGVGLAVLGLQRHLEQTANPSLTGIILGEVQAVAIHDLRPGRVVDPPLQQHADHPLQGMHGVGVRTARRILELLPQTREVRGRPAKHVREQVALDERQVRGVGVDRLSQDPATHLPLEGESGVLEPRHRSLTEAGEQLGPQSDQVRVATLMNVHQERVEKGGFVVDVVTTPHARAPAAVHVPHVLTGNNLRGQVLDLTVLVQSGNRPGLVHELPRSVDVELLELRVVLDKLVELDRPLHGRGVAAFPAVNPDQHVGVLQTQIASRVAASRFLVRPSQHGDVRHDGLSAVRVRQVSARLPALEVGLDERGQERPIARDGELAHGVLVGHLQQVEPVGVDDVPRRLGPALLDGVADDVEGLGDVPRFDHDGRGLGHHLRVAGEHGRHGRHLVAPLVEELLGAAVRTHVVAVCGVDLRCRPLLVSSLEALGLHGGRNLIDQVIGGAVGHPGRVPHILAAEQHLGILHGHAVVRCHHTEELDGVRSADEQRDLLVDPAVPALDVLRTLEVIVGARCPNLTGRGGLSDHLRTVAVRRLDLGRATAAHQHGSEKQADSLHLCLL